MKELPPQEIQLKVWDEKYRDKTNPKETSILETHARVCEGVYANDTPEHKAAGLAAMRDWIWCPAGRIHATAGTQKTTATLINCYVCPTIADSMRTEADFGNNKRGIMQALNVAAYTQQMGGGIGQDFSELRPYKAGVRGAMVEASGPLPFMDMWDSMCSTVMASGWRRGAMMATLRCDHPDIISFIEAKKVEGRFKNFNVSVLVTDLFMEAVKNNADWHLGHRKPPFASHPDQLVLKRNGEDWFVYQTVKARWLWDLITETTYTYAEPGVIFIDRINRMNNLWYCEDICSTNPCGEQPLPPNGACNLGAINLAALVDDPFGDACRILWGSLGKAVTTGMRFLDNVLDVILSNGKHHYPTEEQYAEAMNKRRTGLGITGLANTLQQLKIRYGSSEAVEETEEIMAVICKEAYWASVDLAKERGPFPLWNKDQYMRGKFIRGLPSDLQDAIAEHGIRNGVLLTIAPTGTTSLYYGNVSSGIEPTFDWSYKRKMLMPDDSRKEFTVEDYGYRLYKSVHGIEGALDEADIRAFPDYMVTTQNLTVENHLDMQAAAQKWVDSSISKTINCPGDMSFEDFQDVYTHAYKMHLKGCTTFRPNPEQERVRGSVLSTETKAPEDFAEGKVAPDYSLVTKRPEELQGKTYKRKWPGSEDALYITINDYVNPDGTVRPFEVFINTKNAQHQEWVMALTRMISAIYRRGGDIKFVAEELLAIHSSVGGAWVGKKYVPSIIAMIGAVLEEHIKGLKNLYVQGDIPRGLDQLEGEPVKAVSAGMPKCPKCHAPTLVHEEGCDKCLSCGYSNCGG